MFHLYLFTKMLSFKPLTNVLHNSYDLHFNLMLLYDPKVNRDLFLEFTGCKKLNWKGEESFQSTVANLSAK